MSEKSTRVQTDPLFLGLTRPPMLFGVTLDWFVITFLVCSMTFIMSRNFMYLFGGGALMHGVGLFVCSHEPRFKDLMVAWGKTVSRCRNKLFHGNASSYDLF